MENPRKQETKQETKLCETLFHSKEALSTHLFDDELAP